MRRLNSLIERVNTACEHSQRVISHSFGIKIQTNWRSAENIYVSSDVAILANVVASLKRV